MLFQGEEFTEEEVREAYEEAKVQFLSFGVKPLSFEEWIQYNNDYFENKEKALNKWVKNSSSKKDSVK